MMSGVRTAVPFYALSCSLNKERKAEDEQEYRGRCDLFNPRSVSAQVAARD